MIVTITYTCIWQIDFAPNYVLSKCGKCFNAKTNREIMQVYNNGCIGYNINGKFYSLTKLRNHLVKIKLEDAPF